MGFIEVIFNLKTIFLDTQKSVKEDIVAFQPDVIILLITRV
jgi:lipid A disaccharide synthetase